MDASCFPLDVQHDSPAQFLEPLGRSSVVTKLELTLRTLSFFPRMIGRTIEVELRTSYHPAERHRTSAAWLVSDTVPA